MLKKSEDLDILGVTLDSKMFLRNIFAWFPEHFLKGLDILRKSCRVFNDSVLLER